MSTTRERPLKPGSGAMFDTIAERYDLLNRLMSFGLDQRWRRKLVASLGVPPDGSVLDVATGTADVAIAIAKGLPGCTVVGLDPSHQMLAVGNKKIKQLAVANRIELVPGDAQALPFADKSFDAACISFGIRNVPDRLRGLQEMTRVVRPGGRVVVLELGEPSDGLSVRLVRFHVHSVVPWMGALLSGRKQYRYLQQSIEAFPPPETFEGMMQQAGLRQVQSHRMSFGAAHLFIGTRGNT